jgi:hypothetical protein
MKDFVDQDPFEVARPVEHGTIQQDEPLCDVRGGQVWA